MVYTVISRTGTPSIVGNARTTSEVIAFACQNGSVLYVLAFNTQRSSYPQQGSILPVHCETDRRSSPNGLPGGEAIKYE